MSAERKYLADVPTKGQRAATVIRIWGIIGGLSLLLMMALELDASRNTESSIAEYFEMLPLALICIITAIILLVSGVVVRNACQALQLPTSKIAIRAIVLGSIGLGLVLLFPLLGSLIIGMTSL